MAIGDVTVSVVNPIGYNGAYFDGVDDVVVFSHKSNMLVDKFTFSSWIKPLEIGGAQPENILSKYVGSVGSRQVRFRIAVSGALQVLISTDGASGTNYSSTTAPVADDVWSHCVVSYDQDAQTLKIYHNGVLLTNDTNFTGTIFNASTDVRIGRDEASGSQLLKGYQRDVRWYNRQLTDAEVLNLYNGNNITSGLIHHWKLQDDYNDSVINEFSSNGTNTGSVLTATEDNLTNTLAGFRIGATDKYFVIGLNNGVMASHIAES